MSSLRILLPMALMIAACSSPPAVEADGGSAPDGGGPADAAVVLDAGISADAGLPSPLSLAGAAADPAPWESLELWSDSSLRGSGEALARRALPTNDKVRSTFPGDLFVLDGSGDSAQDYRLGDYGHLRSDEYFVLGSAPGWRTGSGTPVLLVHGAGDDLNRAWAHPWEAQTPASIAQPGLMQALSAAGIRVFAVSFAHVHGDNLTQAQLLAAAIDVVRAKTGAAKVDLVAHSKGNLAVAAYLSTLHAAWPETAGRLSYRGDVRRYLAIAAPFKGVDTAFRSYPSNLGILASGSSAPLGFNGATIDGAWRDYPRWTIGSELYRGQVQSLYDWVADAAHPIPLVDASGTLGGNAVRDALYHGGTNAYLRSVGIDAAIANAGPGRSGFIAKLDAKGIDPGVGLAVLYGTNAALVGGAGESADPSDGLIFVASASAVSGVGRRGASVLSVDSLDLNHLDLARSPQALAWVAAHLR